MVLIVGGLLLVEVNGMHRNGLVLVLLWLLSYYILCISVLRVTNTECVSFDTRVVGQR